MRRYVVHSGSKGMVEFCVDRETTKIIVTEDGWKAIIPVATKDLFEMMEVAIEDTKS